MIRALPVVCAIGFCALAADVATTKLSGRWFAHVKFLADDSMEGRNAATLKSADPSAAWPNLEHSTTCERRPFSASPSRLSLRPAP